MFDSLLASPYDGVSQINDGGHEMRVYVGLRNGKREVFWAKARPTDRTHGNKFDAAIGPFDTVAGARYMADYGFNNPHLGTVAAAEYYAGLVK